MDSIAQLDQKIRSAQSALSRHQKMMERKARTDVYHREERAVAILTDRLEQLALSRQRLAGR